MFLETLLGSKAKVKVLRVLAETRTAFTLPDIKNETELSVGIIHQSLSDLVREGIVLKIKGKKKQRLFKLDTDGPFAHHLVELFRLEKTRQRKEAVLLHTWNVLESVVAKLKGKAHLILLFGSQARGEATVRSDIDVLIVSQISSAGINSALSEVKSRNTINPTIMSLSAFQQESENETLFYQNIRNDSFILHIDNEIVKEIGKFLEDIQYKVQEEGRTGG